MLIRDFDHVPFRLNPLRARRSPSGCPGRPPGGGRSAWYPGYRP